MIPAGGASFKLRHPVTGVMTEVAHWCTDIDTGADQDSETNTFFNPGAALPTKVTNFGAITRSYTLTGKWTPAAETFFNALQGSLNVPYEYIPRGVLVSGAVPVGTVIKSGAANIGAWPDPGGNAAGTFDFSIEVAPVVQLSTVTIATPAADTITSSSVADPTVITTSGAHGISAGDVVTIASHTGSTPDINGVHTVMSVPSTTTLTIPVSVTVGGTGGTVQA